MNQNEIECIDPRIGDRRKCTDCESHPDMETFRTQVKTGVLVASFFLLAFMGWMVAATLSQAERGKEFEKSVTVKTDRHKAEVQGLIEEITCQVDDIRKSVSRMETAINTLVQVTKMEHELIREDRARTDKEIERLKSHFIKNSSKD